MAALAGSWGTEQPSDGKVVCAEFGVTPAQPSEDCFYLTEVANVDQALDRVDRSAPAAAAS